MMMRNDDEDTEKSLDSDLIGVTVGQAYLNPGFKPLKGHHIMLFQYKYICFALITQIC